jgi:hypothetical protein
MAHLLATLLLLLLAAGGARAATLAEFFGSYVGTAEVIEPERGLIERRDMDIVVAPWRQGGFHITWTSVSLVDGRRDVQGVRRRVEEVIFQPAGRGRSHFVAVSPPSVFREAEAMVPMRGDPVRWAVLDGESLIVYSFVVLEDGRYELQVYDRRRTGIGIDIAFERIVDGVVARRVAGRTVRAD